jgi:hypothetical protein
MNKTRPFVKFFHQFLVVALLLSTSFALKAQRAEVGQDTVVIQSEDTVLMQSYAARYNPRKAVLYAAVLPGLGQAYNKKYWKIPLIYGGGYALYWFAKRRHDFYVQYRQEIFENVEAGQDDDSDLTRSGLPMSTVRSISNRARRERDLYIIVIGLLYAMQMVDAHVDAHLKEFDINPNLRVGIEPKIESDMILGRQTGLSLTFKF